MKKLLAAVLLSALFLCFLPAQASIGRDILMVCRNISHWAPVDIAITLEADGSRRRFDLRGVPLEVKTDPDELLFFLRIHGLSESTRLYDAPLPEALSAIPLETVREIRSLLAQMKEAPFEPKFRAFDAGRFLLYGIILDAGEAKMSLIEEGGSHIGQSPDPRAAALAALAGPLLMGE